MKIKFKFCYSCSDFVKHEHKYKFTAWICGRFQKIKRKNMMNNTKNLNIQNSEENILYFSAKESNNVMRIGVGPIIFNGVEIGYCDGENITWEQDKRTKK